MQSTPSPSLETVADYFSSWRQNRVSKKEPIPESLRKMAITLKNSYPVGQIKAALNINSNMLKRWSSDHITHHSPEFVALPTTEVVRETTSSTVKLEYPNGICLTLNGELNNDTLLSLARSLFVEVSR